MELEPYKYFHLYNRSNARELIFRNTDNYLFFLKNFRTRFENTLKVTAYCLMPTHFHFLVQINTEDITALKKEIGIHLASYTKAFNNAHQKNGSLFQQHTKAKLIDDENYLITLMSYIHQNPVRIELVEKLEDWPFSSYRDLAGFRNGTLVDRNLIEEYFPNRKDFIEFSEKTITDIKDKYWI